MQLHELLDITKPKDQNIGLPLEFSLSGISINSREIKRGYVFVALPSVWPNKPGGEVYINDAIRAGASVIVTVGPSPAAASSDVAWLQVDSPHLALSKLAHAFYRRQPKRVVAITGTNGKSSTVDFTFQYWSAAGFSCAKMGTITTEDVQGNYYPGFSGLTTPDSVVLHQNLDLMAANGMEYLAMEASSHALKQSRMDSVAIDVAAFTNLTHEHLDYHKDVEDYFTSKARLFCDLLPENGVAVLNVNDPCFSRLSEIIRRRKVRFVTYGKQMADFAYDIVRSHEHGQTVRLGIFDKTHEVSFSLIGDFQVENAVCAMANAIQTGVDADTAITQFSRMRSVPGRLQHIGSAVYIDYAHTPDALATVLKALRSHTNGRLHVVFGCGGNRDPGKRPLMGKVASELADVVYVTDDNPRFEDPAEIRKAILHKCPQAFEFASRSKAISAAINDKRPGDIILIAGKGHETGQIFGDDVEPFCDVQVATEILQAVNKISRDL